jgi:PAS domain S-box-containing protein
MNAKVLASNFFSKLQTAWRNLTKPSPHLVTFEDRRRAQITSSALLAITLLCFIIEFFLVVNNQDEALDLPEGHLLILGGTLISFGAYWLSRTRHYLLSVFIFLILTPVAVCIGLIMRPPFFIPIVDYLLIGIMVSGMLFSIRRTLFITAAYSVVTMITMTLIAEQYHDNVFFRLLFVFTGAVTLVIFTHYRNLLAHDRQQIIKETDARIRQSHEMYRTLAKNLPKATVFLFDHDLRFIIAQGYDFRPDRPYMSDIEGKTVYDVLPKSVAEELARFYRAALLGEEHQIERQYWGHHFALHFVPVLDAQGHIFAGMLLSQEISERKRAADALRQSEEQLRSLIASIDDLVFSIDKDGKLLVYQTKSNVDGDTPITTSAIIGKHYYGILPEPLSQRLTAAIPIVTTTYTTQQVDYTVMEDGNVRHYSARVSPMIDDQYNLTGVTVLARDVTELIAASQREQRLLELETLTSTVTALFLEPENLSKAINDAIMMIGETFRVSRVAIFEFNVLESLGYNRYEWCAPGIESRMHLLQDVPYKVRYPNLTEVLRQKRFLIARNRNEMTPEMLTRSDELNIQSFAFIPYFIDDQVSGTIYLDDRLKERQWLPEEISVLHAISESYSRLLESKRAREALVEARDAALRSARLKSEFMSNMSHEIRTPMGGLMGMLELLSETELNSTQQEFLELSNDSARRLLRIVDDILDFSKLEAGRVALECIPFEPERLVEETAVLFQQQAAVKGVNLHTRITPHPLPRVAGDSTRLHQVLVNLTSNALKFTEKGEIVLAVSLISADNARVSLRFEVCDTGIGIPLEHQSHIFESFVQADNSTTRRYGGTGLGLAISKQLVELMGSHIEVWSEPNKGSTFAFTLSLLLDQPTPLKFASASQADAAHFSLNGDFAPHILLAENDEVNIRLVTDALNAIECHLDIVRTGEDALNRILQGEKFDLILMDIHMPVMDGLEATRRIRAFEGEYHQTPIIAFTASVLTQEQAMYYDAGMNGIIRKPYSVNDLRANIVNWIKSQTKQGLAEQ